MLPAPWTLALARSYPPTGAIFGLACAAIIALLHAGPAWATGDIVERCLDSTGASGVETCRNAADRLSADKHRLRELGDALNRAGRHAAAVAVFETASRFYPRDRVLLQGLISSRGERRARQLLDVQAPPSPRTQQTPVDASADDSQESERATPCWAGKRAAALAACEAERRARPDDVALHERTGDILRSAGRADEALAAYAAGLQRAPDNARLRRKRDALTLLVTGVAPPPMEPRAADDPEPGGDKQSIVIQLELLKSLHARGLVDDKELAERRSQILASAFPASDAAAPTVLDTAPSIVDPSLYGRYMALVIGNDEYNNLQNLRTPVADARAVSQVLRDSYGFEVRTLLNADRYGMAQALSQLRKNAGAADNVLIYYAGHGYLDDTTKRGYWLPVDADKDNFANWISTSDVTDTLAGITARHALVVADSCFSGALLRGANVTGPNNRDELLKRLLAKRSRTVLTSGGLEPVLDNGRGAGRGEHSVFANAFLDALRTNRGVLETGRLFLELRDVVSNNAEQTPQYAPIRNAGHEGGDFVFVRGLGATALEP